MKMAVPETQELDDQENDFDLHLHEIFSNVTVINSPPQPTVTAIITVNEDISSAAIGHNNILPNDILGELVVSQAHLDPTTNNHEHLQPFPYPPSNSHEQLQPFLGPPSNSQEQLRALPDPSSNSQEQLRAFLGPSSNSQEQLRAFLDPSLNSHEQHQGLLSPSEVSQHIGHLHRTPDIPPAVGDTMGSVLQPQKSPLAENSNKATATDTYFFYAGKRGQEKCICCGERVSVDQGVDPLQDHLRRFPKCGWCYSIRNLPGEKAGP